METDEQGTPWVWPSATDWRRLLLLGLAVALVLLLVAVAAWLGWKARGLSAQALAADKAVWVARCWKQGQTLAQVCQLASQERGRPVPVEEWDLGTGEDLALGPIVDDQRICVKRDLGVEWRPAK